jgi:hypothetical protein
MKLTRTHKLIIAGAVLGSAHQTGAFIYFRRTLVVS